MTDATKTDETMQADETIIPPKIDAPQTGISGTDVKKEADADNEIKAETNTNNWPAHYDATQVNAIQMINRWLNNAIEYVEGKKIEHTKAFLGRTCGIKASTLSQVLSGKYASNPSKFLSTILDYLERLKEREILAWEVPVVETSVYDLVLLVCRRAHRNQDFGILSGEKGVGKTFLLRHYVAQTPSAILVECTPGMTSSMFLSNLLSILKIKVTTRNKSSMGTKDQKMNTIINHVKDRDRLLILDEADKVNDDTLEYARRISDLAGIGCVLSGTSDLRAMVQDQRGRHGQISSRVGYWPPLIQAIPEKDATQIVAAIYAQKDINVPEKTMLAYWKMCDGRARVLTKLVRNVIEAGLNQGHKHSPKLVYQVGIELMGLDLPKGVKI